MRRLWWLLLLIAGPLAYAQAPVDSTATDSLLIMPKQFPLAGNVYVLDPGHGGNDTGTKREWPPGQKGKHKTYVEEKQLTLGLIIAQKRKIEEQGGIVVTTVVIPDSVPSMPFGQNRIPVHGAEYFNLPSRPPIVAGAQGLNNRFLVAQRIAAALPNEKIHWISPHFDWLGSKKAKSSISGIRIFDSAETRETTFVQVQRLETKRVKVDGKRIKQRVWVTADSIVNIRPSRFVLDLAQAFADAGWLREDQQQPIVASGKIRYIYIIHGERDPKSKRRHRHRQIVFNPVFDRVLVEYATLNNDQDWEWLQQPDGSLERLAEITVQGLIKHAQREDTQRGR